MKRLSSNASIRFSRLATVIAFSVLPFCILLSATPSALLAAGYARISIAEEDQKTYGDPKRLKSAKSAVSSVLKGTKRFDDRGKASIQNYYTKYFWPSLSNYTVGAEPANPVKLEDGEVAPVPIADLRLQLYTDLAAARSDEARKFLVDLTFVKAREYAMNSKLHPAVRYNAVLIMGDLTETRGERGIPAVPLPKALGQLANWISDARHPDFIKMGALLGIARHAELRTMEGTTQPLPEKGRKFLISLGGRIAASKCPPNRDPRSHTWMQRRAVELLGTLAKGDISGTIGKGLNVIMSGRDRDLDLRCTAATALATANLKRSGVASAKLSEHLLQLVIDCTNAEVDFSRELILKAAGGVDSRYGGEGGGYNDYSNNRRSFDEGFGDEGGEFGGAETEVDPDTLIVFTDPTTVPSRRRLITRMQKIRAATIGDENKVLGLTGNFSDGPTAFKSVVEQIDLVLELTKEGTSSLRTYARTLKTHGQDMADLLPKSTVPAAAPKPAADPAAAAATPAPAGGVPVATPPAPSGA